MDYTLQLPAPLFEALSQAAAESGTTPVGWIAAHVPTPATKPERKYKNMLEAFEGHIGNFASEGPSSLAERASEQFGDDLEQKRREGIL